MLSEYQKINEKRRLKALPELPMPRTVRLMFKKVGTLQYISHLDLQRTFMRVLNRACIPVWYTKGFNPHAKLVFSTPLSVGAQSVYEFLDIRIDREMSCEEIMSRLNAELTDELCILEAYVPNTDFRDIAWSEYDIEIKTEGAGSALARGIYETLTTSPLMLLKRSKSGEKEVDIIPMIHSVGTAFDENTDSIKIKAVLKASSVEYLNPELLITGLKQKNGVLCADPMKEEYSIVRKAVFFENMEKFK